MSHRLVILTPIPVRLSKIRPALFEIRLQRECLHVGLNRLDGGDSEKGADRMNEMPRKRGRGGGEGVWEEEEVERKR